MSISTLTRERPFLYFLHQSPPWQRELGDWLGEEFFVQTSVLCDEGVLAGAKGTAAPDGVVCAVGQLTEAHVAALQRWRILGDDSATPLMLCAESMSAELRQTLFELGARDVILWPCPIRELLARVRNGVGATRRTPLRTTNGTPAGEIAIEVDYRSMLERTVQEMRVARDVAERASSVKSNFLRMMSHELRTPIATMQLQLRLLEREGLEHLDGRQRDHLDRISRSTRRLIDLVNTILEYARIESGRFRPTVSSFQLQSVLDEAVSGFATHAKQKSLQICVAARGALEPPPLSSDIDVVRLIAVNLLGNAVKHTEKGKIEVGAEQVGERHVLWVKDSGPGIPRSRHAEVFEPFQNFGDIRQLQGAGSGLGLAIVRDMVLALGGEIALRSEEGQGCEFRVSLPDISSRAGESSPTAGLID